ARWRTVCRHGKQACDQKTFFFFPSVVMLVARRVKLQPLRHLRWDGEHRKVSIAYPRPINCAIDALLIRMLLRIVDALTGKELGFTVHYGDATGRDRVERVARHALIADARPEREFDCGHGLPATCEFSAQINAIGISIEAKTLHHLDTCRFIPQGHGDDLLRAGY